MRASFAWSNPSRSASPRPSRSPTSIVSTHSANGRLAAPAPDGDRALAWFTAREAIADAPLTGVVGAANQPDGTWAIAYATLAHGRRTWDWDHARAHAARLVVADACRRYESGEAAGAEANMAKMLAAEASWQAGEAAMQTLGGFAFAAEYDIERKFRETRLYQVAPVSTNLILAYIAEHVLGLPKSY